MRFELLIILCLTVNFLTAKPYEAPTKVSIYGNTIMSTVHTRNLVRFTTSTCGYHIYMWLPHLHVVCNDISLRLRIINTAVFFC